MLFLAGKGDTTVSYLEVTDREPYLIEGIRHNGDQTKGACLVPKRALAVMQGEVNRLLQLTSSSVIPIMYQVPRKVRNCSNKSGSNKILVYDSLSSNFICLSLWVMVIIIIQKVLDIKSVDLFTSCCNIRLRSFMSCCYYVVYCHVIWISIPYLSKYHACWNEMCPIVSIKSHYFNETNAEGKNWWIIFLWLFPCYKPVLWLMVLE